MKTLFTVCMILSFAGMSYAQAASETPVGAPTAEEILLAQVYQIAGQNQSADVSRAELQTAAGVYENSAQADGREERMADALVTVGGFDSATAHDLTSKIAATAATATSQEALQNEIVQIASQMPHGAQFSACNPGLPGLSIFLVGAGFITVFSANNHEPQAGIGAGLFVLGAVSLVLEYNHCSSN